MPFRLRSRICSDFKSSNWAESIFWIMFDDKFNNFKLLTSCKAMDGNKVMKFSDKSNFSNDDAPYRNELFIKFSRKIRKIVQNDRKHTWKTSLFSWINRFPAKKISFGEWSPLNAPPSMLEIRLYRKSIRSSVGCAANASDRIVSENRITKNLKCVV